MKLASADSKSAARTTIDEIISDACECVPGVRNGALVLLAEAVALGGAGAGGVFEREPLVRAAVRCFAAANALARPSRKSLEFVEYSFVSERQIIVILRGLSHPGTALALACARESNLAFVLGAARQAHTAIEAKLDPMQWES